MSVATRPAAVAGTFYDDDPIRLRAHVRALFDDASPVVGTAPKALIAPHAGHVYSGAVAATAYRAVAGRRGIVERVVLMGPAHREPVRGLAVPTASAFATPLGDVRVDAMGVERVLALPQVLVSDGAHAAEHSLEVHLPFLLEVLGDVAVVPILAGLASAEEVAEVLGLLWDGDETLVIVSSDLSHYHDHATAKALDAQTADRIVARRWRDLDGDCACGAVAIRGLLLVAERRGLPVRLLDLRSSADTAGPPDRVVGYGSFAVG